MRSSPKSLLLLGLVTLLLLSVPFSSAFTSEHFLESYKSFISSYLSFFGRHLLTGKVVVEEGQTPGENPETPSTSGTGGATPPTSTPSGGNQNTCSSSNDCSLGYYCYHGACIRSSCFSNADCSSGLVCRNGVCEPLACVSDEDRDSVCDDVDNCPTIYNFDQADFDEDGIGDVCDNCRRDPNPDQRDSHRPSNGLGDMCDPVTDTDNDYVRDEDDNCPTTWNADQLDSDSDGIGDVCDPCPTIAGACNNQCPAQLSICEVECPTYPEELADTDGDGFAWSGCFTDQSVCNQMTQCCAEIAFSHCGDCDDVDDEIGSNSYPGAVERCGDGADNDCDGQIDEGCDLGAGASGDETGDESDYLIVHNENYRSAAARALALAEQLDLTALRQHIVTLQEDMALAQATLKSVLAFLYMGDDSTGQSAQQLARIQTDLERVLAQGRSLTALIDAEESRELILANARDFSTAVEQVNKALEDAVKQL